MTLLELIEDVRRGRNASSAKEKLYTVVREALLGRLERKISSRVQGRLDAEDVLHTAFLKALNALEGFQAEEDRAFIAWVYAIAKNTISDAAKRRSVAALHFVTGDDETGPRASQIRERRRTGTTQVQRREWIELLLGKLPPKEAEVIRLRELQGWTFEEIAASWKKNAGAVQRFHSRAREHLREVANQRPADS